MPEECCSCTRCFLLHFSSSSSQGFTLRADSTASHAPRSACISQVNCVINLEAVNRRAWLEFVPEPLAFSQAQLTAARLPVRYDTINTPVNLSA